jgi:hypothetical protein
MKADFGDRKGGGQSEGREWPRWPRDNEQMRGDDFFSKLYVEKGARSSRT